MIADPAALIFVTNPFETINPLALKVAPHFPSPPHSVLMDPKVTGKSGDDVVPTTNASFAASTAIPLATSSFLPPRYVEYSSVEPSALNLVTNASCGKSSEPPSFGCSGCAVGKLSEKVPPATNAVLSCATAIAFAPSISLPPKYVEYDRIGSI